MPDRTSQVVAGVFGVARGDQAGRKVSRGQDRAVTEEDGPLESVVELADVSRPRRA